MKITEQTSTILKLQVNNKSSRLESLFSVLFGGLFSLGAGIAVILIFAKVTTLNCDKATPRDRLESTRVACQLTSSVLLIPSTISIPPGHLQSAEVEMSKTGNGADTYRVVLITKNQEIPLTNYFILGGRSDQYQKANKINTFLSQPEQLSLKIRQGGGEWFAYPVGGFLILLGVGLTSAILTTKLPNSCIFDKRSRRVYLTASNIFTSETSEHTFKEIEAVRIVEENLSFRAKNYHLILLLRSGEEITLQHQLSKRSPPSDRDCEIVQTINQFLEIEPESSNG